MSDEGKCPHCPAEYSTAIELARHATRHARQNEIDRLTAERDAALGLVDEEKGLGKQARIRASNAEAVVAQLRARVAELETELALTERVKGTLEATESVLLVECGCAKLDVERLQERVEELEMADVIVQQVPDGHSGEIDVFSDGHSHHYVPTSALVRAEATILEASRHILGRCDCHERYPGPFSSVTCLSLAEQALVPFVENVMVSHEPLKFEHRLRKEIK